MYQFVICILCIYSYLKNYNKCNSFLNLQLSLYIFWYLTWHNCLTFFCRDTTLGCPVSWESETTSITALKCPELQQIFAIHANISPEANNEPALGPKIMPMRCIKIVNRNPWYLSSENHLKFGDFFVFFTLKSNRPKR